MYLHSAKAKHIAGVAATSNKFAMNIRLKSAGGSARSATQNEGKAACILSILPKA